MTNNVISAVARRISVEYDTYLKLHFIQAGSAANRLFLWPKSPKYVSTTLFISAIKDGLMLSGTFAVLILLTWSQGGNRQGKSHGLNF